MSNDCDCIFRFFVPLYEIVFTTQFTAVLTTILTGRIVIILNDAVKVLNNPAAEFWKIIAGIAEDPDEDAEMSFYIQSPWYRSADRDTVTQIPVSLNDNSINFFRSLAS